MWCDVHRWCRRTPAARHGASAYRQPPCRAIGRSTRTHQSLLRGPDSFPVIDTSDDTVATRGGPGPPASMGAPSPSPGGGAAVAATSVAAGGGPLAEVATPEPHKAVSIWAACLGPCSQRQPSECMHAYTRWTRPRLAQVRAPAGCQHRAHALGERTGAAGEHAKHMPRGTEASRRPTHQGRSNGSGAHVDAVAGNAARAADGNREQVLGREDAELVCPFWGVCLHCLPAGRAGLHSVALSPA